MKKYRICKLGLKERLMLIKWEKEYKEKMHTDKDYRSSLLYVAPSGIFQKLSSIIKSSNDFAYMLYDEDNKIAGWLVYNIVRINNENIMYIKSLFIHPSKQNKGLGKDFVREVVNKVYEKYEDMEYIEALVDYENKKGNIFFERLNPIERKSAGNDFYKYRFDLKELLKKLNDQLRCGNSKVKK